MKKILSAMLAFTVIISFFNVTVIASDAEFSIIKHTWVAGTGGKITASSDLSGISYESSNTNILTVENNGTFTAVSEGTASVIPYVNGVEQAPVEITVFPSGIVSQNVVDDINTGKLIIDTYGTPVKDKNKGSKLLSLLYETGSLYYNGAYPGMGVQTDGADNGSYMAFLYKLDETPESVKASFYKYGTDDVIKDRVSFGFLTDETTVAGTVLADNNLNQYGVRQALIAGPPEGSDSSKWVYRLTDDWNCVKDISWNLGLVGYDGSTRLHEGSISSIPTNAKYMAVFINLGLAANGKIMKEEGTGETNVIKIR